MIFSLENTWMWGFSFFLALAYVLFYMWYKAPTIYLGAPVVKNFSAVVLSIAGFVLAVSFLFLFASAAQTYLASLWMR